MIREFPDIARGAFDSILTPLGYACISESHDLVSYRGGVELSVILNIRYDNGRSYEVGVEFVTSRGIASTFTLGQLMGTAGQQPFEADGHQASTVDALSVVLKQLATLTVRYAMAFLRGDEVAAARTQKFISDSALRYGAERDAREARSAAELAWTHRDYKKVVTALEKLANPLSPAELAKLEYCRGKAKDNDLDSFR